MNEDLKLDIHEGIGLITLNRPEALNTFNAAIKEGLGEAYRRCDEDDAVRVIVLTGAGKAFCAGADLSGDGDTFGAGDKMDFSSCPLSTQAWDLRKPVIAAVNGHALGVGLGIAMQADIRVFAEEGKYVAWRYHFRVRGAGCLVRMGVSKPRDACRRVSAHDRRRVSIPRVQQHIGVDRVAN